MLMRGLPLLILLALVGLFAAGLARERPDGTMDPPPPAVRAAPALDLPALISGPADMAHSAALPRLTLRAFAGRWTLVNFFASWCVPCAAENDDLKALAASAAPGKSLAILGIAYKDTPRAVAAWLAKYGNAYAAVGLDADGRGGIDWGITGVPESFLVDPAGRIVWHMAGPLDHDMIERDIQARIQADVQTRK